MSRRINSLAPTLALSHTSSPLVNVVDEVNDDEDDVGEEEVAIGKDSSASDDGGQEYTLATHTREPLSAVRWLDRHNDPTPTRNRTSTIAARSDILKGERERSSSETRNGEDVASTSRANSVPANLPSSLQKMRASSDQRPRADSKGKGKERAYVPDDNLYPASLTPQRLSWQSTNTNASSSSAPRSASAAPAFRRRATASDAAANNTNPKSGDLFSTQNGRKYTVLPTSATKRKKKRSHTFSVGPAHGSVNSSRSNSLRRVRKTYSGDEDSAVSSTADADDDEEDEVEEDVENTAKHLPSLPSSVAKENSPSHSPIPTSSNIRYHLPRSVSEVVSSPNKSMKDRHQDFQPGHAAHREEIHGRRAATGTHSPTHPNTTTHTFLGEDVSAPFSRTSSSSGFSPAPSKAPQQHQELLPHPLPPLRDRSQGLRNRSRETSTSRPGTGDMPRSAAWPSMAHNGDTPIVARKRAKSAMSVPHRPPFSNPEDIRASLGSFPPNSGHRGIRSASSTHPTHSERLRGDSGSHRTHALQPQASESQEPALASLHENSRQNLGGSEADSSDASPSGFLELGLPSPPTQIVHKPKSLARPMSITAYLDRERSDSRRPSFSASKPNAAEPSLAELLQQVDVKGALALVREVQNNSTGTFATPTSETFPRHTSSQLPSSTSGLGPLPPRVGDIVHPESPSMPSLQASAPSVHGSSAAETSAPLIQPSDGNARVKKRLSLLAPTSENARLLSTESIESDKKKRRITMAGVRGVFNKDKDKAKVIKDKPLNDTTELSAHSEGENPNEILEKVSPSMFTYVSLAKQELEKRYMPIYSALASGQPPPNPAEIARWRYRRNEVCRRNRILQSSNLGRREAFLDMSAEQTLSLGSYEEEEEEPSLYDKLRANGHRHPIWEVYPRDYTAFKQCKGAILEEAKVAARSVHSSLFDSVDDSLSRHQERSASPEESLSKLSGPAKTRSGRPVYHRHPSSDVSLRSAASIKERDSAGGNLGKLALSTKSRYAIDETIGGEIKKRTLPAHSSGALMGESFGPRSSTGSGTFSPSRSTKSNQSSNPRFTREEPLSLLRSSQQLSSGITMSPLSHNNRHKQYPSVSESAHQRYHNAMFASTNSVDDAHTKPSSTHFSTYSPASPHFTTADSHGGSLSDGNRRKHNDSDKAMRSTLQGDREPEATPSLFGKTVSASSRPETDIQQNGKLGDSVFGLENPSEVEYSQNAVPKITPIASVEGRPVISRHSSRSNSIANISRILGASKRRGRNGNDTDGYKSTDNEETSDFASSVRGRKESTWKPNMPMSLPLGAVNGNESAAEDVHTFRSSNRIDEEEAVILEDFALGDPPITTPVVVDIQDEEFDAASHFLEELRSTYTRADALAPRVPAKLQLYLEEFYSHDVQRQLKGQLASIQIDDPPTIPVEVLGVPPAVNATPVRRKKPPRPGVSTDDDHSEGTTSEGSSTSTSEARSEIQAALQHRRSLATLRSKRSTSSRIPHLDKVATELEQANESLQAAEKEVKVTRIEQESLRSDIAKVVTAADTMLETINGEVFQQLRMLEDHFMRLKYQFTETSGYADALWAVLSYVLRICFWLSWVIVIFLRLIKFAVLLPIRGIVLILRLMVSWDSG